MPIGKIKNIVFGSTDNMSGVVEEPRGARGERCISSEVICQRF